VHAAFAGPVEVVAERRALYRLAAELFGVAGDLPDDVFDSPLVRYLLGGALAGRVDLVGRNLAVDRDSIGKVDHVGLPVVADPMAQGALADLLRIVGPVEGLRLITMADEGFGEVLDLVDDGVRLVREVGGALAEDLLAHVDLIAVVDPATAGGLVSASSRYFPGVVVVERPSTAVEIAEALIHEGAHEKFFDLAITRSFFDVNSDLVEEFTPSWSGARWPFEQVFAAWHAYLCLAQFARAATGLTIGSGSLLPKAAERSTEIGEWLLAREAHLLDDARWMLATVLGSPYSAGSGILSPRSTPANDCFVTNPLVRSTGPLPTGRTLVGRFGSPPDLFWLENDSATILDLVAKQVDGTMAEDIFIAVRALWDVDENRALERWRIALENLVRNQLIFSASWQSVRSREKDTNST
jgi:hypothetical protein